MSDKSSKTFRTSMSGYNKSDVLAYIDKMNADYRAEVNRHASLLAEKDKKILELEKKCALLDTAQAELERVKSDCAQQASELCEKSERLTKCEAVIASQSDLLEELRLKFEELDRENANAVDMSSVLENYADYEQKAKLYDGISAQLGEILIAANKSADSIVSASNEKAGLITSNAMASALAVKSAVSEKITIISSELKSRAQTISANYYDDIACDLMDLRDTIATSLRDVTKRAENLSEKTEYMKSQLDTELDGALKKLDEELARLRESLT